MENNIEQFKKFVRQQLEDFDEYREADLEGFVTAIADEAVKLFPIPHVMGELPLEFVVWYSGITEDKIKNAFERWKTESGNFR